MMYQVGDLVHVTIEKTKNGSKVDPNALYAVRSLLPNGAMMLQKHGPHREQVILVDPADVLPQDISVFLKQRREDFLQGLRDLEELETKVKEREAQDAKRAKEEQNFVTVMAAMAMLSQIKETEESQAS